MRIDLVRYLKLDHNVFFSLLMFFILFMLPLSSVLGETKYIRQSIKRPFFIFINNSELYLGCEYEYLLFDTHGNLLSKADRNSGKKYYEERGHYLTLDNEGNYFQIIDDHTIAKINKVRKAIKIFGREGRGAGKFKQISGLAVDKNHDYLYVIENYRYRYLGGWLVDLIDPRSQRVQKFDLEGKFISEWNGYSSDRVLTWKSWVQLFGLFKWLDKEEYRFNEPVDIVVDTKGHVYVLENYNNRIQKFDGNGKLMSKWGKQGAKQGEFNIPQSMAIDNEDNIYVADTGNDRIQKFDSNGKFLMEIK